LELTGAYAVFANGGYAVSPHVIERVRTPAGKVRYLRPRDNFGRVADPHLIGMLNTMLHQTLRSGTATHAELQGWAAAGKTGTSQDFRDAWFIGYTPHLVIGVWLGNDDGSPTKRTTGGGPPVDIWNRVMQAGHRGVPVASLPGVGRGPLLAVRWFNPAQPPRDDEPISMDRPPADVGTAPAAHAADAQSGIDGWLMGKIFGR
jgi:penicillin-binding protein 1A